MPGKIEDLLKEEKIKNLKLSPPVEASKEVTLEAIIHLMQTTRNGYVVVTERKKPIGVFSEKDLTLRILEKGVNLKEPLSKHMRTPVRSLTPEDSVGTAIEMMHDHESRHIPLVNKKKELVGVLSVRAIIGFLSEHFPAETLNLPPKPDQISDSREGG